MKKLVVGSMLAAGSLFMGAQMASATQDGGYGGDPDGSVSPLPPVQGPGAGTPGPAANLPSTGGEAQMLMQIGLVTFAAGGALVGASAVRRRRLGA